MSGSGGHFSIRGIKGANVGEMIDGVPLNDSGNYAIYPGELVDPETISTINVITGSSDVDAALSSSLGGTVNINTLTPTDDTNAFTNTSYGSWNYWRVAGLVNTGTFGPWDTKAWIEGSQQMNDKYTGVGHDKKWQVNFKVYQDLHHYDDFIAVAGFYDRQLADFYFGDDFASFTTSGTNKNPVYTGPGYNYHGLLSVPWNSDYHAGYVLPSTATANAMFQGVEENPTWTGNLRGAFALHHLRQSASHGGSQLPMGAGQWRRLDQYRGHRSAVGGYRPYCQQIELHRLHQHRGRDHGHRSGRRHQHSGRPGLHRSGAALEPQQHPDPSLWRQCLADLGHHRHRPFAAFLCLGPRQGAPDRRIWAADGRRLSL